MGRICQTGSDRLPDVFSGLISIAQDGGGRDAEHLDALSLQPSGSAGVAFGVVVGEMDLAIDLNRQLQNRAVEVQDERSNGVLTPEARPAR